MSLEAQKMIK